jgi:hypothetical protein
MSAESDSSSFNKAWTSVNMKYAVDRKDCQTALLSGIDQVEEEMDGMWQESIRTNEIRRKPQRNLKTDD